MPKGEDIRYLDSRERSQRALVGTIEATIRAVEEAEEEIAKPPHIDLPRFGETQRHWKVEVEKESVGDRLAAMGAATAEVVQLTAIPEESTVDTRVGNAIATIGSNLPEMGRGVRELAALMPDEHRAGDLVGAARKLCNAFGNFLDKVHPEHQEKRANILSAASRVGELSNDVLSTIQERTEEELSFHDELNRKARAVATSTAQLVLQAKTVSADCDDPGLKDKVIQSAMKTAYATSELVACTRVVGPTIEHPPCKEHLTDAAYNVTKAVHELLEDASKASQRAPPEKAENFENLRESASRVTNALDDIIGHVQHGPWEYHRKTQQDYTFEQIVESSNRILAHPGGAPELFHYSEKAIRNSQMLVDGMEQEANQLDSIQQREKLLNAARSVAQATSSMIDATRECQNRPGEAEPQLALKSATSQLVQATSHATIDRQIRQTIQQLEKSAKEVASATTQTIAAANSARPFINNEQFLQVLVQECVNTGRYVPPLVQRIKENQTAKTPVEHFKAQVGLIHECQAFTQPSANLVDLSRSAVSYVEDKHASGILLRTSQQLSVYVAEMITAINNAQQLDFEPYLEHSEEFISSLDHKLQEIAQQIRSGYPIQHSCPSLEIEGATNSLRKQSRLLNSAVAQMVSAAYASERRRVSMASMEMVQSLGDFTESINDVVAARQEQKGELHSLESLILNARSVVHDSGRIFDRIRERNSQQLEEAARKVTESLRRTLDVLPGDAHIEQAIEKLRNLTTTSVSSSTTPINLRTSANQLIGDVDNLLHCVHSPETESQKCVEQFSNSFEQFYSIVTEFAKRQIERRHQSSLDGLSSILEEAVNLLERFRFLQSDKSNISLSQALSTSSRQFSLNVWTLVELVETHGSGSTWLRECDQALQKIKAIRHLFGPEEKSAAGYILSIPLNGNSYYESLAEVTNEARNLGDGMNGLAHYARRDDTEQLCLAVRKVADSVCGLAKNAAQSTYLIGVGDTQSEPGRAAIYDVNKYLYSVESLQQAIDLLNKSIMSCDKRQLLDVSTFVKIQQFVFISQITSTITMHSSDLASICRDSSEKSANISVRSQLVNSAMELTSITAALITAVRNVDKCSTKEFDECLLQTNKLRSSVENLHKFLDNPDFGPIPAKISFAGRQAQQPLIGSTRKMLDASSEMIGTAKALNENPSDAAIWQQIANNSSIVSESIKQLVAAIRDEAPGQADLDQAINILSQLIQQVDNACMAAAHNEQPRIDATTESTHQQILHSSRQMLDIIDPLKIAAISHAEAIGRNVRQQLASAQTLAQACIQSALLSYDSRTQATIFEQCKTVLESSIQLMFATKDSGGNPKAVELHTIVEESAEQQQSALLDMQRLIQQLDTENGLVNGLIDGISRSIAIADKTQQVSPGDSLADIQARMVSLLNVIGQTASDVPLVKPTEMGQLFLQLDEHFRSLAEDSRIAQSLMSSSELRQKLKTCVQNLGMACIELVKIGSRRRTFPNDQRLFNQLSQQSSLIEERIREVLVVLSDGARGTLACVNAAQTVSGIIGDLDTTIMFATSGSLNPPSPCEVAVSAPIVDHRDALFEDTKALVSGAASNQEQLAVAAQNSVRSILQLTEAVKSGASKLSPDSTEAQVMMIHAVRDVASALSNLIQATTHASGRSTNDPAIGNLKEAAKVMVSNVSSLLKAIKTIEDSSQRGAQALEAAINAIDLAVKVFFNIKLS
uniref:Vinculin n=1 Tax=Meloidogyne hapla TaxID=6305 RepID=A0A1I8B1N6_MELHA